MEDIVKMTSYNASLNHNWNKIAQIKENYFADFVVLDKDNKIIDTYIDGKLVK
jgi:N-acetylglucosamine-6-phosphate deacetylase